MTSIALYYLIYLLLNSTLVGICGFTLFGEKLQKLNHWKAIFLFAIVLTIMDSWALPFIFDLDISLKVGNKELVEMFSLPDGYLSLTEYLKPGWFDLIELFIGSVVAYNVGNYIYESKIKRNLTSRST